MSIIYKEPIYIAKDVWNSNKFSQIQQIIFQKTPIIIQNSFPQECSFNWKSSECKEWLNSVILNRNQKNPNEEAVRVEVHQF